MQKVKLLKLAEFLETKVPKRKFDLSTWAVRDPKKKECVTTACAFGHATNCWPRSSLKLTGFDQKYAHSLTIEYTNKNGRFEDIEAAQEFFGITEHQADYLFVPDYYPHSRRGAKSVASRIRKFVEINGKIPEKLKEY